MKPKFLIGIDEAGRGPLAGPVAVGVFCVRSKKVFKMFKGVRDSKKLTENQREAFFLNIKEAKKNGHVHYAVSFSSAGIIDKKGIVPAIKSALNRSLRRIDLSTQDRPALNYDGRTESSGPGTTTFVFQIFWWSVRQTSTISGFFIRIKTPTQTAMPTMPARKPCMNTLKVVVRGKNRLKNLRPR